MRIVVFGGGMQGRVIAANLSARKENVEVIVADVKQPASLPKGVKFEQGSVLDEKQTATILRGADAAVLAVPSEIAHAALENLIKSGVPIVDVSFTPDPPLSLNDAAVKSGAVVVVDCGVAPGLSHMLVGSANTQLGGLDSAKIYVGGMPQNPPAVFNHAVYFNPQDLFAEYIRPARARYAGKEVAPAPLDAPIEPFKDRELGNLESFLSDGLRSLLTSFPNIPEMEERTLRWKGHLETMENLRQLGLFECPDTVRNVAGAIGTRFPAEQYPDVLLMVVECRRGNQTKAWRMIDRVADGNSAMSRTTGFTTAATAMVLARKEFTKPGVHAPEVFGADAKLTDIVVRDLAERGVVVSEFALAAI